MARVTRFAFAFAFAFACVVTPACSEAAPASSSALLETALNEHIGGLPGPIHYFAGRADLDGDRHPEWIVHLAGPFVCGTGGCDTMVFKEAEQTLALVGRIPLTRPPIAVAETTTEGWRDLIVHVRGGGILPGHDARLRYDGTRYAPNPTLPPAEPVAVDPAGETVIPPFRSFREGEALRD